MQLVEQGRLDLDRDVNEYLTQFEIPDAFDAPITMTHLLTHTAGFEDGGVGYLIGKDPEGLGDMADFLEKYMPARVRAPGSYSSYSNYSTTLAGLIVSNISGMPFDDYIERHIFEPLGMTRSTFREPLPEHLAPDMSAGFARRGGDFIDAGFEYIHNWGPAGSLSATAADMARFMIAHLQYGEYNGARILEEGTARRMQTRLFGHHPALPGMAHGFYHEIHNGRQTFGHGGDTVAFHSEMTLAPEENVGIYVSFNAPDGGVAARQVAPAFFDEYFPAEDDPHPSPPRSEAEAEGAAAEPDPALAKYVGAYRANRRSYTKWEKVFALLGADTQVTQSPDGGLVVAPLFLSDAQRVVAVGDGVFRSVDDPDMRIAFEEGADGAVRTLFVSGLPFMAYDRLGPLEQAQTHQLALGLCLVIFAGVALGSLWGLPKWLAMSGGEKIARLAVFGAAALNLAFVAGFAAVIAAGINTLLFDLPDSLSMILTLPVAAAAFAALGFVMVIPAWASGYWSLFGRIRYTLVAAAGALFALGLNYWNLLGPWYLPA
ncbi:MAG: serine hydrolase [Parvularculaceae bacterium]